MKLSILKVLNIQSCTVIITLHYDNRVCITLIIYCGDSIVGVICGCFGLWNSKCYCSTPFQGEDKPLLLFQYPIPPLSIKCNLFTVREILYFEAQSYGITLGLCDCCITLKVLYLYKLYLCDIIKSYVPIGNLVYSPYGIFKPIELSQQVIIQPFLSISHKQ